MKFKVREGFFVHVTSIKELAGEKHQTTSTYVAGETVDLDTAQAKQHLHKLEPIDKDAKAFCEANTTQPTSAPAPATADIEAIVADRVAAALKAAGIAPKVQA